MEKAGVGQAGVEEARKFGLVGGWFEVQRPPAVLL